MSRIDLGAKPYLIPQPVMIIATYNANGTPNAMNAAWGGIVGQDELIIDLGSHKTTDNIAARKAFTVSIADTAHVVPCDYVGMVSGNKVPDKIEKAGFTVTKSKFVDAPIINELPLALECELIKIIDDNKYLGRIKNVSADESIIGESGTVTLEKFAPIIYDTSSHGYYKLGDRVGDAWGSGKKLI
jgi:flavin reductase (DIM6/NTAB) family NADH-FMN oxidoreductase RutF